MADNSAESAFEVSLDQKITDTMTTAYREHTQADTGTKTASEAPATTETAPEAKAEESAEVKAERQRDEKGRFTKAEVEAAEVKPEVKAEVTPTTTVPAAPAKPPSTWTKAAQEKFLTLDPEVQQEVLRREGDMLKGMGQYTEAKKFADEVRQIVQPYEAMIRAEGGTVPGAIQDLLNTAYVLRTAPPQEKQQLFVNMAQQFGVDLAGITSGEASKIDPNVSAIQQELRQLKQSINTQRSQSEQEQVNRAKAEIAEFSKDKPHFESVREDMAALINSGRVESLEDAYEHAIWMNPATRSQLLAAQQAELEKKRADEETRRIAEAKRASAVNLTSKPVQNPTEPVGSIEDTMRATFRRVQGAA